MKHQCGILVSGALLGVFLGPATSLGQERIAKEASSVCAIDWGQRLEGGAALPRKPTPREIRKLRARLYDVADAAARHLASGNPDVLPEERFMLASSRYCVAATLEFRNALITEFSIPKLDDPEEITELSSGLKRALDPAIDQIADAHAPEEGKVCYFSATLGIWICIEIFIDIDIDL